MELKLLLLLIKKWIWVLLFGVLAGAGLGYAYSYYQIPIYESLTKVMVMQAPESPLSKVNNLSDQELAQTYIQLLTTQPVLEATSAQVNVNVRSRQISAQQIRGTRLLEVRVRDSDPERAAQIANTLVSVLIEQNDALQATRFSSSEESLQAQVAQIEQQMTTLQFDIDQRSEASQESVQQETEQSKRTLETQIYVLLAETVSIEQEIDALTPRATLPSELPPPLTPSQREAMRQLQTELAQKKFALELARQTYFDLVLPGRAGSASSANQDLQGQQQASLALYQQIYSSLLSNYESVRLARLQNTPNVVQVERAAPAGAPVQPRPLVNTVLGAALSLLLVGSIAFLLEYLDDTLKTPADISSVLGLPVLGYVASSSELEESHELPFVAQNPRAPIAEAFRGLRTNLEFASVDKPLKTILITSPGPSEGKSTIAANLAAAIAQGNKRVILLDGDLRRPRVHRMLGMSNHVGLSEIFRGQSDVRDVARYTKVRNLAVITSGSLPPNPAELLGSDKMTQILERLEESASIVVIDSPPFVVADASVLASKVDGVVLVIQPGRTHAETAKAILEQLNRAGARVVGVVLNRIPRQGADYYGGYRYYHYDSDKSYSYEGNVQQASARSNGRLLGKFWQKNDRLADEIGQ